MEGGNLVIRDTGNPKVFAFQRIKGRDHVNVMVNLSNTAQGARLDGVAQDPLAPWAWRIW